jgi:hypothetical protein
MAAASATPVVSAATAEGGDVAGLVDALEARHDDDRAGIEIAADVVAVDIEDAGLGEGVVGQDAHLAAGVAAGLDADSWRAMQSRPMVTCSPVEITTSSSRGWVGADFLGQGDQAVGLAAHRGQDDHHLVPLGMELRDPLGHVLDPFGVADGSAAIFLNYERHLDF